MKKETIRFFSLLLTLVMAVSLLSAAPFSAVAASVGSGGSTGSANVIYLRGVDQRWTDYYGYVRIAVYDRTENSTLIPWDHQKGKLNDESNGLWSYDFDANGFSLDPTHEYSCTFFAKDDMCTDCTCDLIFDTSCMGDTVYMTGGATERKDSFFEPNTGKWAATCDEIEWQHADPTVYGNPKQLSVDGNIIGNVYWRGETDFSFFVEILNDLYDSTYGAIYGGRPRYQVVDQIAPQLGLSETDVLQAIAATGKDIPWTPVSERGTQESGKIYFDTNNGPISYFNQVYVYLVDTTFRDPVFNYASRKGRMTDEGDGIWSYSFSPATCPLYSNHTYTCMFTVGWSDSADLILDASCFNDTAYMTVDTVESIADSNKSMYVAAWKNADPTFYGTPVAITSIGNVVGSVYMNGDTPYSLFLKFISSHDSYSIDNAVRFTNRTYAEQVECTAKALGLTFSEIKSAIDASGRAAELKWTGFHWGDFVYEKLDDNICIITNYTGFEEEVTIPDAINGNTVIAIGDWVFANNKYLQRITLPGTLQSVGKGAFYNCTGLTEIVLPPSVTELGANAFEKCLYLESADIGSVTEIKDETFFDCRRLRSFSIPATVSSIGEEAFTNCRSLTGLTIPAGVQTLGSNNSTGFGMFENCKSLTEIKIPASVTSIQSNAFDGCKNVTIVGAADSYAQSYAAENTMPFRAIIDSLPVGDANSDDRVNILDVTAIQRHISEHQLLSGASLLAADTNGDGVVDINDATHLQMYLAEFDGIRLG